jgi:hypothetical protein
MELQPDYKVSFWGVRCYMTDNPETYLWGTNWFFDLLLPIVTKIHNFFWGVD